MQMHMEQQKGNSDRMIVFVDEVDKVLEHAYENSRFHKENTTAYSEFARLQFIDQFGRDAKVYGQMQSYQYVDHADDAASAGLSRLEFLNATMAMRRFNLLIFDEHEDAMLWKLANGGE